MQRNWISHVALATLVWTSLPGTHAQAALKMLGVADQKNFRQCYQTIGASEEQKHQLEHWFTKGMPHDIYQRLAKFCPPGGKPRGGLPALETALGTVDAASARGASPRSAVPTTPPPSLASSHRSGAPSSMPSLVSASSARPSMAIERPAPRGDVEALLARLQGLEDELAVLEERYQQERAAHNRLKDDHTRQWVEKERAEEALQRLGGAMRELQQMLRDERDVHGVTLGRVRELEAALTDLRGQLRGMGDEADAHARHAAAARREVDDLRVRLVELGQVLAQESQGHRDTKQALADMKRVAQSQGDEIQRLHGVMAAAQAAAAEPLPDEELAPLPSPRAGRAQTNTVEDMVRTHQQRIRDLEQQLDAAQAALEGARRQGEATPALAAAVARVGQLEAALQAAEVSDDSSRRELGRMKDQLEDMKKNFQADLETQERDHRGQMAQVKARAQQDVEEAQAELAAMRQNVQRIQQNAARRKKTLEVAEGAAGTEGVQQFVAQRMASAAGKDEQIQLLRKEIAALSGQVGAAEGERDAHKDSLRREKRKVEELEAQLDQLQRQQDELREKASLTS